ncbi:MAG: bifunctional protein-serine/threonine kinase/phosphatase [Methylococcales bacterium]|jgi:eukaryotic-like serine/threonine-protein kinase|nr:bifunctional protein-serine/threonine kinase/phosphatase [Methylococcales bacterium]MBT7408440.1 bifunctional protein-serine/threonine kinase/phosphatase [Methylococcales bacterium]
MHIKSSIQIQAGQASDKGIKKLNEDCMGIRIPDEPLLTTKGIVAVIADGVSSAEAGKEASATCVQNFLSDYYSTPDAWTVKNSAHKVLTALNRWLYGQSQHYLDSHKGYITTLSILVIKSHIAYIFHIGDSRIYRLRNNKLEQLTHDHATQINKNTSYLSRAMGMDIHLEIDFSSFEINKEDCFFLSTDGIHDFIKKQEIQDKLCDISQPEEVACQQLIDLATQKKSPDNLTCQIIRIKELPQENINDIYKKLTELPFPPELSIGMSIDGYKIIKEIYASNRSQVFVVKHQDGSRPIIMKTPSVNYEDDPAYIERFTMEQWIGRRINHPNVIKIIEPPVQPSFLYYCQEYNEGITLTEWIKQNPKPEISVVIDLVKKIAAGLRAFHLKETLHQDLKPDNVIINQSGQPVIIDFGSCFVAGIDEISAPLERDKNLGTIDYSAPEYALGKKPGITTDLFSLASITYEMLTGHLPYGEKLGKSHTLRDFSQLVFISAIQYNPMIPIWLNGAIKKGTQINSDLRQQELSEFIFDLEHPNKEFTEEINLPLLQKNPLKFWKGLSFFLFIINLLLIYMAIS